MTVKEICEGTTLLDDEIEYIESIEGDEFLEERFRGYVEWLSCQGKKYAVKTTLEVMMPNRGARYIDPPQRPFWW